jgi:hypothetical protein
LKWDLSKSLKQDPNWELEAGPRAGAWSRPTNSIVRAREHLKRDLGGSFKQDLDWELETRPRAGAWRGT